MSITICTSSPVLAQDINLLLDDLPVEFTINKNSIALEKKLEKGFYLLKLKSYRSLKINDILIDGNSIRHLKWLSFSRVDNKIFQPSDEIWSDKQEWILPIIYPISCFYNFSFSNIRGGQFGKNLFDLFDFYFPEKIQLGSEYPNVIKSYFDQDSEFKIIPKSDKNWYHGSDHPFKMIKINYDRNAILKEIEDNIKLDNLNFDEQKITQVEFNQKEFGYENPWAQVYFLRSNKFINDLLWNHLKIFCNSLPVKQILHGFISKLPSKSFIYPHCDSSIDRWGSPPGIVDLYVPLGDTQNIFFKFGKFGCVDLTGISIINNRKYPHAVVNDSNRDRFILSLKIQFDETSEYF